MSPTTATESSPHGRRPHIILGITGSIAAVKGPRLALRLANELKAHVKVVLTRTVEQYFWKEGRAVPTYDGQSWIDFERAIATSTTRDEDEKEYESDWKSTSGRICIHCEHLNYAHLC
jgi:phosphopantothenoylcysteine synthetase/decarboxylase